MTQTTTFLKNRVYQLRAVEPKSYSWRKLARLCGFKSPNYVKLVVDGERFPAPEGLSRIMSGLAMTAEEKASLIQTYFSDVEAMISQSNTTETL